MTDFLTWLRSLGLDRYAQVFADNDVDLEALRLLSERDLQELGVSLGHRKKLLKAVVDLAEGPTATALRVSGNNKARPPKRTRCYPRFTTGLPKGLMLRICKRRRRC